MPPEGRRTDVQPSRSRTRPPLLRTAAGGILVEGILAILLLALFFAGILQVGVVALRRQGAQQQVDETAWRAAAGLPHDDGSPLEIEENLLWARARYPEGNTASVAIPRFRR